MTVAMHAKNVGTFATIIAFKFSEEDESENFHIVRYMTMKCTNSLVDDLQPESPYVPPPRISSKPVDVEVVEGFPLPRCVV